MSYEEVFKKEGRLQIYHGIFMLYSIGLSYEEIDEVIKSCIEDVKTEVKENT